MYVKGSCTNIVNLPVTVANQLTLGLIINVELSFKIRKYKKQPASVKKCQRRRRAAQSLCNCPLIEFQSLV